MGIMDSVENAVNKGFTTAKSAVSGVALEQTSFVKGFAKMCTAGVQKGWNEANGGNASYRLTSQEVEQANTFFKPEEHGWHKFPFEAPILGGAFFLVTAAGCYMTNVEKAPAVNTGIVEINGKGDAYRTVWGFTDGAHPTSEFTAHALCHAQRMHATSKRSRVLYHAHPSQVIALTMVTPLDGRFVTRLLWRSLTESILMFPEGVGVIPWDMPGSASLAQQTATQMTRHKAVIWATHGVFASGSTFDSAFGLLDTIDKAAGIANTARMLNGGSFDFPNAITDEQLERMATTFKLPVDQTYLHW